MLDYTLNTEAVLDGVSAEIARAADSAYAEDGTSLYDEVVNTERDDDLLKGFISDALRTFASRVYDICKRTAGGLQLYVPDFDTTLQADAFAEIDRYIVMATCMSYFAERRAALVPEYDQRSQAALAKAVLLLKSRKSPDESWS